jgi:hypothetical protein
MLRTLLIAAALLTAPGMALAHGSERYGRVVEVEPSVSISFGTGYHDGFRVLYESGGSRYWTYSPYYPGRTIVLPPRHEVRHVYHHHYRDYGWRGDDRRGWGDHRRERHHRDDD